MYTTIILYEEINIIKNNKNKVHKNNTAKEYINNTLQQRFYIYEYLLYYIFIYYFIFSDIIFIRCKQHLFKSLKSKKNTNYLNFEKI
jgi:hypothetical protein